MDPLVIGRIHAKWCGHCKTLVPEWDNMSKNIENGVKGGKYVSPNFVDFESEEISQGKLENYNLENKELLGGKNVEFSGFPTLFKVKNKRIEYYDGERLAEPMEKWFMSSDDNRDILQKYDSELHSKSASLKSASRRRHSFSAGGRKYTRRYKKSRKNRHNKTRKHRRNKRV